MTRIALIGGSMGENSFGQRKSYVEFLSIFGDVFIITPSNPDVGVFLADNFHLIVLPGGADVSPLNYNRKPSLWTGNSDPSLEYFDQRVLPGLFGAVPIFGICRGLQTLNVCFGGTLYQNISHPFSTQRTDTAHGVFKNLTQKKPDFEVNSMHHQAISKLSPEFGVDFYADDGTIEAVSSKKLRIVAVQWHPEEIYDEYSQTKIWELLGEN